MGTEVCVSWMAPPLCPLTVQTPDSPPSGLDSVAALASASHTQDQVHNLWIWCNMKIQDPLPKSS